MSEPLLAVRRLSKTYRRKSLPFLRATPVQAITGIDLDLLRGSTVGLVGRSGCGKSTLARCIARLEQPEEGEVWLNGRNLLTLRSNELKAARRAVQIVFQHSATSINPRFAAADAIAEPLRIQKTGDRMDRSRKAAEMMERVGIPAAWGTRSSLEFSGGERQRLALARSLVLRPQLLILDEALAGLDRATQDNICQLLVRLQAEFEMTYLFITHDLLLAARLASRICVMDGGRIVESAATPRLFENARSEPARRLIESIPKLAKSNVPALDSI
jgi:peptide/nickel transport system ATP-binding protein